MTAPVIVSPCCGAKCHINLSGSGPGMSGYYVCEACGQPCDPMPREVRDRIVAEGMRRAADICYGLAARSAGWLDAMQQQGECPSVCQNNEAQANGCAAAVRREAERLAPKRRDIQTSPDTVDATPPSGAKLTPDVEEP